MLWAGDSDLRQRMGLVRDRRAATAEWREGPISETGMCSDQTGSCLKARKGERPTGQGLAGDEPVSCRALPRQENQADLVRAVWPAPQCPSSACFRRAVLCCVKMSCQGRHVRALGAF